MDQMCPLCYLVITGSTYHVHVKIISFLAENVLSIAKAYVTC